MTPYNKGRAFEYRVQRDLESRGWWTIRSAGSKGPADIVAIKGGKVLLVQCKANAERYKREGLLLAALARSIGAHALIARRVRRKLVYEAADDGQSPLLRQFGRN
jgi:Holliday junction resolvase